MNIEKINREFGFSWFFFVARCIHRDHGESQKKERERGGGAKRKGCILSGATRINNLSSTKHLQIFQIIPLGWAFIFQTCITPFSTEFICLSLFFFESSQLKYLRHLWKYQTTHMIHIALSITYSANVAEKFLYFLKSFIFVLEDAWTIFPINHIVCIV